MALTGFAAGRYVAMKIEAITPAGVAMASEPGLFSADLTYIEEINR
jgi:hypothetical protein